MPEVRKKQQRNALTVMLSIRYPLKPGYKDTSASLEPCYACHHNYQLKKCSSCHGDKTKSTACSDRYLPLFFNLHFRIGGRKCRAADNDRTYSFFPASEH